MNKDKYLGQHEISGLKIYENDHGIRYQLYDNGKKEILFKFSDEVIGYLREDIVICDSITRKIEYKIQLNMKNLERHKIYLRMCVELSQFSKCSRNKVGSMLVDRGRIISTGVNGTPSGSVECQDYFKNHDKLSEEYKKEHSEWSLKYEGHSEMNSLLFASKNNVQITEDTILYCTHEPCDNCLKHLAIVGIKEIYYASKYYNNISENIFNLSITHIPMKCFL